MSRYTTDSKSFEVAFGMDIKLKSDNISKVVTFSYRVEINFEVFLYFIAWLGDEKTFRFWCPPSII